MPASFKDHFSGHAGAYAAARPDYPPELFIALAAEAPRRESAWDCATGSGQAAVGLAGHFARVVATDASAAQLVYAQAHPRVRYHAALGEACGLTAASLDVVTVAQALHWFDLEAFWPEVRRVLRPGGVVAAWCYQLHTITPEVDRVVRHLYDGVVGPYWPPERRLVDAGYGELPFPFDPLDLPPCVMVRRWRLEDLLSYLGTWSACRRYQAAHGHDPLDEVAGELRTAWGEPRRQRTVRWPLSIRVGRWGGG